MVETLSTIWKPELEGLENFPHNEKPIRLLNGRAEPYELYDPATAECIGVVYPVDKKELDTVVNFAMKVGSEWQRVDLNQRSQLLKSGAQIIRENLRCLSGLLTKEQGKPLKESEIEVRRCADTFDYYAEALDGLSPFKESLGLIDSFPEKTGYVLHRPIGVVGAIVPWNFPLTLLANKLVPGIAAGNAVIIKPAPTTPLATAVLVALLGEVGFPRGLIALTCGGVDVGKALVQHPLIRLISFTGSTATGKMIMRDAADGVKRLVLELGGSDACIVASDADIDAAAKGAAVGRFFNCGQACVAVKRVYVESSIADEFIERMEKRVRSLTVGNGFAPGVRIGPQHLKSERERTMQMIHDALQRGGKLLCGGDIPDSKELARGYFINPTVILDVPEESLIMREECFGPALPINVVANFEEGIQKANSSRFGLGSSVWTSDPEKAVYATRMLDTGYTWINDIASDYDGLPFGGTKESGFGRERGKGSILEFTSTKSVVIGDTLRSSIEVASGSQHLVSVSIDR